MRVWFRIAEDIAERADCPRRKCGAVITDGRDIISVGWNGAAINEPSCVDKGCVIEDGSCVRAVHAEVRAVTSAARQGRSTQGLTMISLERPCNRCLGVMNEAGIKEVWYLRDYHTGAHADKYCSPDLMAALRVTQYVEPVNG